MKVIGFAILAVAMVAGVEGAMFAAGDGSAANPYEIGSAAELFAFADVVNGTNGETQNQGACAKLTADIDLGVALWTPMGLYKGAFDGQGHCIGGLNVDLNGEYDKAGFFETLDGATVQDLRIVGSVTVVSDCTNSIFVGGLTGDSIGSTVQRCSWTGPVSLTMSAWDGTVFTGGLAGRVKGGSIAECNVLGNVTAVGGADRSSELVAGGLVGENSGGVIQDCWSHGAVRATRIGRSEYSALAGGVAAVISGLGKLRRCYHYSGEVTASDCSNFWSGASVQKAVGFLYYGSTTNCFYMDGGSDSRATKLTAAGFTNAANFVGWDFTNVWAMVAERPRLRWEPAPTATFVTSMTGYSGIYDGHGHSVEVAITGPSDGSMNVLYAVGNSSRRTSDWGADMPVLTNVCTNGTVWVEVSAPGYFTATNSVAYVIEPRDIAEVAASPIPPQSYGGQPMELAPAAVMLGDSQLAAGVDYTLSWETNNMPGTAVVTLTGHGNFGGTKRMEFTILPQVSATLKWKYVPGSDGLFCAQFAIPWHAGYNDVFSNMHLVVADCYDDDACRAFVDNLDEEQANFFKISRMLRLWSYGPGNYGQIPFSFPPQYSTCGRSYWYRNNDGNYYMNVKKGDIYTEDFVRNGYKDILNDQEAMTDPNYLTGKEVGTSSDFTSYKPEHYFDAHSVVNSEGTGFHETIVVDNNPVIIELTTVCQGPLASYLVDPATTIDALGEAKFYPDFGGQGRVSTIDFSSFTNLDAGAWAVYGVSDETMTSPSASVPNDERKICLRVKNRSIKNKAEIGRAMLVWDEVGITKSLDLYSDSPSPAVTNVTARQRKVWSSVVDLTFEVMICPELWCPDWNAPRLFVFATDNETGSNYVASASALSGDTGTEEGKHAVTWDMSDVLPVGFNSASMTFTVAYLNMPDYCVLDLSGGADAESYAVSYHDASPGDCKTDKLLMRLVPAPTIGINQPDSRFRLSVNGLAAVAKGNSFKFVAKWTGKGTPKRLVWKSDAPNWTPRYQNVQGSSCELQLDASYIKTLFPGKLYEMHAETPEGIPSNPVRFGICGSDPVVFFQKPYDGITVAPNEKISFSVFFHPGEGEGGTPSIRTVGAGCSRSFDSGVKIGVDESVSWSVPGEKELVVYYEKDGKLVSDALHVRVVNPSEKKAFYCSVFETTQGQWKSVMDGDPSTHKGATRPVEGVSWNDIRGTGGTVDEASFLGKLRAKTALAALDLPTEAQWEHACRAGTRGDFAGTGRPDEMGRHSLNHKDADAYEEHMPVGSYHSNDWGLYDFHGNVWEWCLGGTVELRIVRGGSWKDESYAGAEDENADDSEVGNPDDPEGGNPDDPEGGNPDDPEGDNPDDPNDEHPFFGPDEDNLAEILDAGHVASHGDGCTSFARDVASPETSSDSRGFRIVRTLSGDAVSERVGETITSVPSDGMVCCGSTTTAVLSPKDVDCEIAWKFLKATGTWFAQVNVECPTGLPERVTDIRYAFADRVGESGKTEAALWNSLGRKAKGDTMEFDGETLRYAALDPSLLVEGRTATFGVKDLFANTIPVPERIVELYVHSCVAPVDANAAAANVDSFLGYLFWTVNGEQRHMPLAAGALGRSLHGLSVSSNASRRNFAQSAPLQSPVWINASLAVGIMLDEGSSPYCRLSSFSVDGSTMRGVVEVGASGESEIAGSIGANAKVVLLGAESLPGPFVEVAEVKTDESGAFSIEIPDGCAFFKLRLDIEDVVK